MPGKKERSLYKRKRKGFRGIPSWSRTHDEERVNTNESGVGIQTTPTTSNKDVPSKRKLDAHLLTTPLTTSTSGKKKCIEQCHMDKGDEAPKGYRLMDMKTLGQTLAMTHKCSEGTCGMICT